MFEKVVDFSVRNPLAVLLVALGIATWGYFSFRGLTIEAFPDPTDTQVNVITLFDGQPAEEVERQIGLPLERALNGTPGLGRLRNISMFGLSYVTLTFNDGVDGLWARQQVLERLRSAEVPDGVKPELAAYATPIGEVYRYTLKGARGDPMKLRTLQEWVVRPLMMRVNGVADVVSYGGLMKEIHVQPDARKLASYRLTLDDVEKAIAAGTTNASGGVLERGSEQFVIRSEGLFRSLEDIRQVRVATNDGSPVFLRDVASVSEGWAPRQGVVSRGTDYDAVEGIVLMRRGENPSVVLAALKGQLENINQRLAVDGAEVSAFYDRTELVDITLRSVGHNLIEGAVLVTFVLFAFLLELRAALIVTALIPLSLLSAFIYLRMRGMSANLLSMGAVDFGVIVDGGVVIIESILTRLYDTDGFRHMAGMDDAHTDVALTPTERIRRATLDVIRPTVFALLIIIAAYVPIFMLERVEGRIFAPMANTVVAALVGALFFSVTLVPALAALAFRKKIVHRESPLLRWVNRAYRPSLEWALLRPKRVLAFAAAALIATVLVVPSLGSEFLPELNEGALYMTFSLPSNISLTDGRKLVPKLTQLISSQPQVESIMSQLGRPEDGTDATLTSNLEFFVRLKPPDQWPKQTPELSDVIAALQHSIDEIPGIEVNFSQPIRDNVNESISGQFGQIAVKLYGEDLGTLQTQAEKSKLVISKVPGVADLGIVKSSEVPQIQILPNRSSLARYGMALGEFQHVFQSALGGRPVEVFWEGERKFDIVMRLPMEARDDIEKIKKLRVPTDTGDLVPLDTLAEIRTGMGRASINRENGRRYIGIRMNVRGRDLGRFVNEARTTLEKEAPLPAGMQIEWGGEFENKERAMNRLLTVLPLAIALTLILLFNAFKSLGRAVLTLMNVPFALIGGVLGLWLFSMPLSVAAAVGFIALIGQASLNGVLITSAIAERRSRGMSLEHSIVTGCESKLRPVLMTAALAALGLVPAALSHAIGSETQRPLAVVIVFGTMSASLLTLILLPVMFKLYAPVADRLVIVKKKPVMESTN